MTHWPHVEGVYTNLLPVSACIPYSHQENKSVSFIFNSHSFDHNWLSDMKSNLDVVNGQVSAENVDSLQISMLWIILLSILLPLLFSNLADPPFKAAETTFKDLSPELVLDVLRSKDLPPEPVLAIFRFKDLPRELIDNILRFSVKPSISTYRSLLCVSRQMRDLSYRACLPVIPVTLTTSKQWSSFYNFISAHPELARLVRSLWAVPFHEQESSVCPAIIHACTHVTSLACNVGVLKTCIAGCSSFNHCRRLTVLMSSVGLDSLLENPNGSRFMEQLTHLRVITQGLLPTRMRLRNLTNLSLVHYRPEPLHSTAVAQSALMDTAVYPSLRTVILTRPTYGHDRPIATVDHSDSRLVTLYVPEIWSEMEIWGLGTVWDWLHALPDYRIPPRAS